MGHGPLTGYKVLDLTQFEAGTVCTMNLAWLGAEVWKVERPVKGELGRHSALHPNDDTYGFLALNMNKKSITCNMKAPEGKELIRKLLERSDVIVENMGPGSMERLGLSYEECKAINPLIIYASIKGFARGSRYEQFPAFDPIATHTGGFCAVTGLPEKPIKAGASVADSGTGIQMAMSIVAALLQREKEGIGQRIDLAMQDFIIGLCRSGWEPYYDSGKPPRRVGNGMPLEDVAPSETFACKPFGPNDFIHVYTSRAPGSKQWDNLCHAMNMEWMLTDERFATPHSRFEHKEELYAAMEGWFAEKTKEEAMMILGAADVPAGAVLDIDDFRNDPQYKELGMVIEVDHYEKGKMEFAGFASKMTGLTIDYEASPALGSANAAVYKNVLGLTDEELKVLEEKHVI